MSSYRTFVLLRFRTASSVLFIKCERVKLPPFSSSWAEAISCQHHPIITWKENGTKWFNCGLGTDAENELNVNKALNDKFQLASLVWPVVRKRDAYMMMHRHSAILERERLQS